MNSTDDVKGDLSTRIARAMYMDADELDQDELFSDFGLESITLAKILRDICVDYDCHITVGELMQHQTLRAAAELVHSRIGTGRGEPMTRNGDVIS